MRGKEIDYAKKDLSRTQSEACMKGLALAVPPPEENTAEKLFSPFQRAANPSGIYRNYKN